MGDEVAGEKNRVGVHPVDAVDCVTEEEWLSEFVHVNVAELRDAEAVKGLRKTGDEHVAVRDFDPVPLDFAAIERETARRHTRLRAESGGA